MLEPLIQYEDALLVVEPKDGGEFTCFEEAEIPEGRHVHPYFQVSQDEELYYDRVPDDKKYTIKGTVTRDEARIKIPYVKSESSLVNSLGSDFYSIIKENTDEELQETFSYATGYVRTTYPELDNQDFVECCELEVHEDEEGNYAVLEINDKVHFRISENINILKNETDKSPSHLVSKLSNSWRDKISDQTPEFDYPDFLELSYEQLEPLVWKSDKEGWDIRKFLSLLDQKGGEEEDTVSMLKSSDMKLSQMCDNIFFYSNLFSYENDTQLSTVPNIPYIYPDKEFFGRDDWKELSIETKMKVFSDEKIRKNDILITHCPESHNIVAIDIMDIDENDYPLFNIKELVVKGDVMRVQPCNNSRRSTISVDEYYELLGVPEDTVLRVSRGFLDGGEFVDESELDGVEVKRLFASLSDKTS